MKNLLFPVLACLFLMACSKSGTPAPPAPNANPNPAPAPNQKVSGPNGGNFSSDHATNLNIIYFVPADLDTIPGYQRRLSELLLYDQEWYKKEMQRNGYPNKTFGLLSDAVSKRVKIITVYGAQPKSSYPYSGGSGAAVQEINAYFSAHPVDKNSEHVLIFMPSFSYDASGEPGGPPFYGIGKWCFALDYADFDIKYLGLNTIAGNRLTKWFGGMSHEMGHGLNLFHNHAKVSEMSTLGTTLMGAGNYTFGQSPTFLSAEDCAVLNVNQVFNTDNKTYYGPVNASVTKINALYDRGKAAIIVSGKFQTDVSVSNVTFFNDPNVNNEGTGVNKDYNAIAWATKPVSPDSFYVEMKIADLEHKEDNIPYELKVNLVHDNGNVTQAIYAYTFLNGVPVLNFSTRTEIGKQTWRIVSFSSEETSGEGSVNGRAADLIDENTTTYWHSRWSSNAAIYPHEFVVDMGSSKVANGLSITQRAGLNRSIKSAELWYSADGISFTKAGVYLFANVNGPQYFDFSAPLSFRYFKVIALSAWDGLQYAALAEAGMY